LASTWCVIVRRHLHGVREVSGTFLLGVDLDLLLITANYCTIWTGQTALRRNWPQTPMWSTLGQWNIPIGCWPWPAANYCTIWTVFDALIIPTYCFVNSSMVTKDYQYYNCGDTSTYLT